MMIILRILEWDISVINNTHCLCMIAEGYPRPQTDCDDYGDYIQV